MREKTIGEIADDVDEINQGIKDGFKVVNDRLTTFEQSFVRKDLYEARHEFLKSELTRVNIALQNDIARVERTVGDNKTEIAEIRSSYSKKMWALATGILFPTIVGLLIILFTNGAFS